MQSKNYLLNRDLLFWLFEVGDAAKQAEKVGLEQPDIEAMINAVSDVVDGSMAGLPELLDENEPQFDGKNVVIDPRLKDALDSYIESGFAAAGFAEKWGGMALPYVITQALNIPANAVGGSAMGYLFLTSAAANMLNIVGSEAQKAKYLPNMVAGKWFGTMMLSEPHAGSSIGDMRTVARRQPDGSYHLSGSKMWISAGDHDLSENIIHMVLAKIEDQNEGKNGTVPGTKGISLFLVPKYQVNNDGSLGAKNGVKISGINHKMGNRGTVNTVPVLGDGEPCVGELLGEPGKGLMGMFHMMNEARIGIGMMAAQTGYFGYRYSLDYARERPQGRPITNPDPRTPQINIVEHTDVKRMLLQQKALTEGAMALCLYAAELIDHSNGEDAEAANNAKELLAFLTPIVKTWPSVWGLHANYLGIQVLGGYGYTREYPLERLYRDNRLNEIHEGTTGIQGLDLLGRKALHKEGAALKLLISQMITSATEASGCAELTEYAAALTQACKSLGDTTQILGKAAADNQFDQFLANSTVYLDYCGTIVVAWTWLKMAVVAQRALDTASEADIDFYNGKLKACRYFFRWELPKIEQQAELLQSLDDTCLSVRAEEL